LIVAHSHGARNTTHQCGTLVFGHDPAASVLDSFCRAHDLPNLFVVDGSFFPSSAAVNPGLTIIAQALRVADHIKATELSMRVEVQHYATAGAGRPLPMVRPSEARQ
jgi:choline dehydrogenase-like flavoprotein